jgi:hypothetical protein
LCCIQIKEKRREACNSSLIDLEENDNRRVLGIHIEGDEKIQGKIRIQSWK